MKNVSLIFSIIAVAVAVAAGVFSLTGGQNSEKNMASGDQDSTYVAKATSGIVYVNLDRIVQEYDMANENLMLSGRVRLRKMNNGDLVSTRAESVRYDRTSDRMELLGSASVTWKDDQYSAEVISLDLKNDSIVLDTRIQGTING